LIVFVGGPEAGSATIVARAHVRLPLASALVSERYRFREFFILYRVRAIVAVANYVSRNACAIRRLPSCTGRRAACFRCVSKTMTTDFYIDAVEEAIATHGRPAIFNTDQGSQFTEQTFVEMIRTKHRIALSMDGKGCWRDNVFVERFWRSLKYEEVFLHAYEVQALLVSESATLSHFLIRSNRTPRSTGSPR
jgi:transposase InsO family protein